MRKKTIKLNEFQLRKVITESVKTVLNEYYGNVKQIDLDEVGMISDYELFNHGNANYYFTTDEPSSNNSDTMERFLEMVYDSDGETEWNVDGSQAFAKRYDGRELQLDASGNGDFTHHMVSVKTI